ncbi:MAG: LytR family transcriptional regulator, partial [Solirubrobacterales bacterium]|nr:LytR family transcriptional regulator [Solirubrobacterales bacterium]
MLDFALAALSVSGKIKDAGAIAGFASILGLAVLSVLYFAQARELKRLREWAGRAPERAAEMQEHIHADQQRGVAARPQSSVPPSQRPAAGSP